MNLCSDDHDEVCYEGRHCPACSVRDDTAQQKDNEIDEIKKRISELEAEVDQLHDAAK